MGVPAVQLRSVALVFVFGMFCGGELLAAQLNYWSDQQSQSASTADDETQSPEQDAIDLIVFKLLLLLDTIGQQPLEIRAQLVSLLERESKPLIESTFAELRRDEAMLIRWSVWFKEIFPNG